MRSLYLVFLPVAALGLGASRGAAQSLPAHHPLNPTAASRTGLFAPALSEPAGNRWRGWMEMQYGNAIESELDSVSGASHLLDAELLQVSLGVRRDLTPTLFVSGEVTTAGSYGGFADGFFDWYHDLIHFEMPEREARPTNRYAYRFALAGTGEIVRPASAFALGDVRLGLGVRHSPRQQTLLSLTAPTATGAGGFGRGTVSASVIHTLAAPVLATVTYEGTLGLGITPRHGELARFQRTAFFSVSSGIRWRVWGGQSLYGYLFYHSPYYRGTGLPTLDRRELTVDFGLVARERSGAEWRVGFTEDLAPGDQGIDLIMKIGRSW